MKRIIYFLAVIAFVPVKGQDFSLTPRSISASGPNSGEKDVVISIENNSSNEADSSFEWKVLTLNIPSQWGFSFCDPWNCYTEVSQDQVGTFLLKKGQSATLKCTYLFNNNNGISTVQVQVQSKLVSTNVDTATFTTTAWVTGLSEANKVKSISFFPNPAKDQLNFKFPVKEPVTVDIYNILGVKIRSFIHNGATTLPIADLQNGVYFVRFAENGQLYSKSFTKSE